MFSLNRVICSALKGLIYDVNFLPSRTHVGEKVYFHQKVNFLSCSSSKEGIVLIFSQLTRSWKKARKNNCYDQNFHFWERTLSKLGANEKVPLKSEQFVCATGRGQFTRYWKKKTMLIKSRFLRALKILFWKSHHSLLRNRTHFSANKEEVSLCLPAVSLKMGHFLITWDIALFTMSVCGGW